MREACCLRLMQADGMNDNLSGNPAMPPPTGTTVQDREEITDKHPSAHPAEGMGITSSHPSAPPSSRNGNHIQAPLCPLAAGMEITYRHPYACFQQQPISPDSCQGCPGDISVYIKV